MNFTGRICRYEQKCQPVNMKQGLSCLVHHHPTLTGPEIAARIPYPWDRLKKACNENEPAALPAWVLFRLVKLLEARWVMSLALADAGLDGDYDFISKTRVAPAGDLTAESLDVASAVGHLTEGVRKALHGDGHVDMAERLRIRRAIQRVHRELADVDQALEETAGPRAVSGGTR